MDIKEINFEGNVYYFSEFHPNNYYLKLVNVSENSNRKTVETFCKENNAELAINGGLFNYSNQYILGVAKYVDGIKNSKGYVVKSGSNNKPCIFYGSDGSMWSSIFSDIYNSDVKCEFAREVAYYGLIYKGNPGCFSSGERLDKEILVDNYLQKHKRTMIGQKSDKTIVVACSKGEITGEQQARFMKHRGCYWAFNLDGGGSSHMYDGINKKYIVKGNRDVTDALVVIKKNVIPETTSNFTMRLHSGSTDILDREVSGNKKVTVPVRGKIDIIGLYGWKAGDGYRWAWGKRYGIEGAFKFDPRIMIIEGKPSGNYKMKLTGSAARLRASVVNGKVNITAPNGSEIKILEFLKSIQSDGYQWCYGVYNGVYGYFQHDPAVMYPTND